MFLPYLCLMFIISGASSYSSEYFTISGFTSFFNDDDGFSPISFSFPSSFLTSFSSDSFGSFSPSLFSSASPFSPSSSFSPSTIQFTSFLFGSSPSSSSSSSSLFSISSDKEPFYNAGIWIISALHWEYYSFFG